MTTITIWHNTTKGDDGRAIAMLAGYREGDCLMPVAVYDVEAPTDARDVLALAEDAFRLFNVGDDPTFGVPDERALAYRVAGNRSLSVGDVVQVGTIWLSVQTRGFARLLQVPAGITLEADREHGSTPVELPPWWRPTPR